MSSFFCLAVFFDLQELLNITSIIAQVKIVLALVALLILKRREPDKPSTITVSTALLFRGVTRRYLGWGWWGGGFSWWSGHFPFFMKLQEVPFCQTTFTGCWQFRIPHTASKYILIYILGGMTLYLILQSEVLCAPPFQFTPAPYYNVVLNVNYYTAMK